MKSVAVKMLFIAFTFISLTSCNTFREVKTSSLKIGMSKDEVQNVTKKRGGVIASKRLPDSNKILEVLQFNGVGGTAYWLYFVDGHLDRWEPANTFGPSI